MAAMSRPARPTATSPPSSAAVTGRCRSTCSGSTRSSASRRAPRQPRAGSTAPRTDAPGRAAPARWDNRRVPQELTIVRPDDWHLHVRDGAALRAVVPHSARQFGRAIIMPNLRPPVVSVEQALAYRDRMLAAVPVGSEFEPLMTLYLTDTTPPAEMRRAASYR